MRLVTMTVLLLAFSQLPAVAGGLQPGAKVVCREKGARFTGTLTAVTPQSEPLLIVNPYGGMVRIPLGEIRKIQATGKKQRLTLPWLFPEERIVALFEFSTLDGSRIVGTAEPGPTFDIEVGTGSVREGLGLDTLESIEVE